MNIPILTVHTIPEGYEPIGLIHAMSVHSINFLRDAFAGFTSLIGGKQNIIEGVYNETLSESLSNLKIEGQKVNADLIIGLDIDISTYEQFYIFFCSGTALRKKQITTNRKNENRKSRASSKKIESTNSRTSRKSSKK
jgi:uncharacterized protein YbjQ (UPF0145 family)